MNRSLLLIILLLPGLSHALEDDRLSRSAGKFSIDNSVQLKEKLLSIQVMNFGHSVNVENSLNNDEPNQLQAALKTANHLDPVEFIIFDAWLELTGDIDDDGFYHNIRLTFDADVNTGTEAVYAKLYLSHEGGPWYQYATSDVFEIHLDSADDSYEIMTELIEGYPPGYYDVMIELHSFYHHGTVASKILDSFNTGFDITLEDLQHDDYYAAGYDGYYYEDDYYYESYSHGHSGNLSLALLLLFLILLYVKNHSSKNIAEQGINLAGISNPRRFSRGSNIRMKSLGNNFRAHH